MPQVDSFEIEHEVEILGKLVVVARDGKILPLPGRIGGLAQVFGSLIATPILRMVGR